MTRSLLAALTIMAAAPLAAQQPDTAATRRMMDAVRADVGPRYPDVEIAEPRVRGDTAWVRASRSSVDLLYEYSVEYRFERRDGTWVLTLRRMVTHSHMARADSGAQRRPAPTDTNWVDTITVGRLPTGSCEWSTVRLRPGKRGTTTSAAEPRERTCTVVVYNITTGTEKDPPVMMSFHFVQDHGPTTLPKGTVLNFADTFTVARRPDGECDWRRTPPFRKAPKGSSWTTGEVRVKTAGSSCIT